MIAKCPTCGKRIGHESPSRIPELANYRKGMEVELDAAISHEEAQERGLVYVGRRPWAIRLWGNLIYAIKERKEFASRGAVLVRRRDGKDVEVWAGPLKEGVPSDE